MIIVAFFPCARAQAEKLPVSLQPDVVSQAEADRVGGKAFKLLPKKMYPDRADSYKDEDNPIGIRGGGAYYSFSTGSHSYNRMPEIAGDNGLTSLAYAGMIGISFFADLGPRDLSSISETTPEAEFFLSYKPPLLGKDCQHERDLLYSRKIGDIPISQQIRIKYGDVYLYRSMIWEHADVVVAFEVLKKDPDGSITIVWKNLATLPVPIVLEMSDQEMQKKVDAIIAEGKYVDHHVVVKLNWLYFVGPNNDQDDAIEAAIQKKGIRFRGAGGSLTD
jgi:hypothetical protein